MLQVSDYGYTAAGGRRIFSQQKEFTMDRISSQLAGRPVYMPGLREITLDHPWRWIAAGWRDLWRAPLVSLSFGAGFVLATVVLIWLSVYTGYFFYIPAFLAGFFLLSPVLAYGLYDVSRKLSRGEKPTLRSAVMAWRDNAFNVIALGVMLLMAFMIWMMVANMVFAIFYFGITPRLDNFIQVLFLSGESPAFVVAGMLSGGVIAFVVFCMSAISIPMLLDKKIDVFSAVVTSVRSVSLNPRPMLLWAFLIVMLVGLGLVTVLLGLVIIMPLVGHASWHAYQDLVKSSGGQHHVS
jgi:uncharacterized membrane protein